MADITNEKDKMELKSIITKILSVTEAEEIYLFGSFAYGEPKEDSDFDLCVLLAEGEERPLKTVQRIYRVLAEMNVRSVDIIAETVSDFYRNSTVPALEKTIREKGIRLYQKGDVHESRGIFH